MKRYISPENEPIPPRRVLADVLLHRIKQLSELFYFGWGRVANLSGIGAVRGTAVKIQNLIPSRTTSARAG